MKKRIIITERQVEVITRHLNESTDFESILKKIVADLDKNYEPVQGTYREGGEYFEKLMLKILADGEMTTPKAIVDYLKFKYNVGEKFLKQVMLDWMNGDIKDNKLTKNIGFSQ